MAGWYAARGYEIVDRNWRAGRIGEIDLVAARADSIVFCEVKTRTSSRFGSPAEAVTPDKQRRIRRLAALWLAQGRGRGCIIRFDVAMVIGESIDVIENAF